MIYMSKMLERLRPSDWIVGNHVEVRYFNKNVDIFCRNYQTPRSVKFLEYTQCNALQGVLGGAAGSLIFASQSLDGAGAWHSGSAADS